MSTEGEQYDTNANVKSDGFRFYLAVSYVSNHNDELQYYKTVCLWMTIYIYMPSGYIFSMLPYAVIGDI